MAYLDDNGLLYFWQKMKAVLLGKEDSIPGKGLSTNDFTDELKAKLDGVEAGAKNVVVDSALSGTSENPVQNKVISAALDEKAGLSTSTPTENGLMSASDKSKLDAFGAASEYALKTDISTAVRYKGSKPYVTDLPSDGNEIGDMWNVLENDMNYIWDGEKWDASSAMLEVESITNAEIDSIVAS